MLKGIVAAAVGAAAATFVMLTPAAALPRIDQSVASSTLVTPARMRGGHHFGGFTADAISRSAGASSSAVPYSTAIATVVDAPGCVIARWQPGAATGGGGTGRAGTATDVFNGRSSLPGRGTFCAAARFMERNVPVWEYRTIRLNEAPPRRDAIDEVAPSHRTLRC